MTELFTEPLPVPIEDQIRCVEREIEMRERVYPRWVSEKRLTQAKADRELAAMRAVLRTLQGIAEAAALGPSEEGALWVDESGTAWTQPTAWAYAQSCRVREELRGKVASLERAHGDIMRAVDEVGFYKP